jgi:uncharacterized membrane protein YfcA
LNDIESILILFGVGMVAGIINVMAGGGSTLTLPALIFLGLDGTVANGTNRIAILIQNFFAVYSFKREKFSKFKISFKMSLFTLPGALIGAIAASKIEGEVFEKILGVVMIGIIITMVIPQKRKNFVDEISKIPWLVYLAMFGIGFYGGFIQVGVGFLLMAVLHYLLKENLVLVNVHKVFIVFIYTIPAFIVFVFTDSISWFHGLSLAAGNSVGAWYSAKISVKKGEKVIKPVLVIAIFIILNKICRSFF